jgi:hypothetical protein
MEFRKDLINFFIQQYDYTSYLEIGVKSQSKTFNHIQCIQKEGVDPNGCTTHKMTSDNFFQMINRSKKWDIIFVDGYHERPQVIKDIENALLHLNDNGTIVCHDVNPREEWLLGPEFCWNAWEAFAYLRSTRSDLEMHGVTFDHLGFIRFGTQELYDSNKIEYTWKYLDANRKVLMQELTNNEIYQKYSV